MLRILLSVFVSLSFSNAAFAANKEEKIVTCRDVSVTTNCKCAMIKNFISKKPEPRLACTRLKKSTRTINTFVDFLESRPIKEDGGPQYEVENELERRRSIKEF